MFLTDTKFLMIFSSFGIQITEKTTKFTDL